MRLKFLDDDWDGIESGIVKYLDIDTDEVIWATFELTELEQTIVNYIWKMPAGGDLFKKATVEDANYENAWDYIISNFTPKFYKGDEFNVNSGIVVNEYVLI